MCRMYVTRKTHICVFPYGSLNKLTVTSYMGL
jgi:hypothetical protein